MRSIALFCSVLTVSCVIGCSDSTKSHSVNPDSIALVIEKEATFSDEAKSDAAIMMDENLLPFKAVIDTLNSIGDNLVHSDYFLHDITGDGQPELWIISGTCEANKNLWVYTTNDSTVQKILSDDGGHTEFFLKGDTIGSLTCNTGEGFVSGYSYKNGKVLVESIEYDGWHEKELVKIKTARDWEIADIWENSDSTINLKTLK